MNAADCPATHWLLFHRGRPRAKQTFAHKSRKMAKRAVRPCQRAITKQPQRNEFIPNINKHTCVAAASLRLAVVGSQLLARPAEGHARRRSNLRRTYLTARTQRNNSRCHRTSGPVYGQSIQAKLSLSPQCPFLPTPLCLFFSADWLHLVGNEFMFDFAVNN